MEKIEGGTCALKLLVFAFASNRVYVVPGLEVCQTMSSTSAIESTDIVTDVSQAEHRREAAIKIAVQTKAYVLKQ